MYPMFFPGTLKARWAFGFKPSSLVLALMAGALLIQLLTLSASAVIRDGGIDPANLGKGEWIYFMSSTTNQLGGNVASVTNEVSLMKYFKSQGIRYVIVKAASGNQLFNGSYSFPQFTSNLCNIAHAEGVLIFGYNRSDGIDVPGEIAISDYVFKRGADGFIWDAEAEWESSRPAIGTNGPALAWQLCSTVRSNWPNKFLAHAPFPIISFHNSFPYKEFGYWSDAVMPQIYHLSTAGLKQSVSATINWTDVNYQNWYNTLVNSNSLVSGKRIYWTNAIKPIVPIQDVYGPLFSGPTPDKDVQEFMDYCIADPHAVTPGGYKGVNFFRCDLHGTAQWSYIKNCTSGDFPGIVNNIVLDDNRAAVFGGSWASQRTFYNATFFGTTETNTFGTNYLYTGRGIGSNYVQFTPNVITAGDYDIYEWHPYHTNASASVPYVINYNGGSATVNANQQVNSGTWNLLGRFNFVAGTTGNIRVTDGFPEATKVAMVDGLKLVSATGPAVPPGISSVTLSNITYNSVIVAWKTDLPANSIIDYGPSTNYTFSLTNASLVAGHSVTLTGLNPLTFYHFRIRAKSSSPVISISEDFHFTTLPPGMVPFATIVDNTNATVTGTWSTGTGASDKFGADYRFHSQGTGTNYLQFSPSLSGSGVYEVYEWHPKGSNRTISAPHVINYWGGSQTIGMNQMINGGQWNLMGTFEFAAGTAGNVQITDAIPDAGQLVMADAIKFLYVAPPHLMNVSAYARFNSAIITWNTFPHTSSQVQYGLT
ncbi:MAG: hypothetical protein JWQ71_3093, partial [Pedosphaera sp.]|nr:hypothetical protein [Pedosphaera sp.]